MGMRKPARILLLGGLALLLLALTVPWTALAQTATPGMATAMPTGTPPPTSGAATTTVVPTNQPTAAGQVVASATPMAGTSATVEPVTPQATAAAQELPTSGASSPANTLWSLLPIAALLLLAVPALVRIANRNR
jgi:hypothetical protein